MNETVTIRRRDDNSYELTYARFASDSTRTTRDARTVIVHDSRWTTWCDSVIDGARNTTEAGA